MKVSEVLREDLRPALGCTEPACVAWAAAAAGGQAEGNMWRVGLVVEVTVEPSAGRGDRP